MPDMESVPDGIVLLSLHEVTPFFEDEVVRTCDMFDDLGITSYTLLVTPFYGFKRANVFEKHNTFAEYLLALDQELSLHGYSHTSKSGTPDEFRRMPVERLKSRVRSATALFLRGFKIPPIGFIPPQWIAPQKLVQFSMAYGMQYCVIGNHITSLSSNKSFETVEVIISSGSSKLDLTTSLVELELGGPVQIAVHPQDYLYDQMFDFLADLRDRLGYTFIGYRDFLKPFLSANQQKT